MKLSHQLEKRIAEEIEEALPKGPAGYVSLPAHEIAAIAARTVVASLREREKVALSQETDA